ncbi:MAG: trypsin-like peptidase domain-containing protein [Oscillospiraceae bacterium]|nr:trypsin-like peptidase domain-containing protein [Oscillospiraceae bacterium]
MFDNEPKFPQEPEAADTPPVAETTLPPEEPPAEVMQEMVFVDVPEASEPESVEVVEEQPAEPQAKEVPSEPLAPKPKKQKRREKRPRRKRRRLSPKAAAIIIVTLTIVFIMGISAIAQLFTLYEFRFSTSPGAGGFHMERIPRPRAEPTPPPDILDNHNWPAPPVYYEPFDDDIWDSPPVPRAPLGDGTTMTISPLPTDTTPLSFQEIFQRCNPSVVVIEVQFFLGGGSGTGIVMTENGYIITAAHVVEGARQIAVYLEDGTRHDASLVGEDMDTDIAVLKINATDLTPAEFGDSDLLQVGQEVAVIGNPLGQAHSMSNGIISALNRDVTHDGITMRLIQTNAAINEGNSGGPLINLYGQVVGITNMKMVSYSGGVEGLGFAIPTATIRPVVDSLIQYGRMVGRPGLGIVVETIAQADTAQTGRPPGVYVQEVLPGTDAAAVGLREGDRIVTANGATVHNVFDLRAEIARFTAGDRIELVIERDGVEQTLQIRLMDSALLDF